ncbi:MAG: hypothetical protein HOI66_16170 [Verrucomicrobia bacterium]|nr:hypothetical protein [Verrucomicrobiota bacterium]
MAYSGGGVSPEGGSIYRWNLDETDSGTPVHIYPHLEKAWDLEISADGGILAAVLGSSVVLREIDSGQIIGSPLVHSRVVYDIRFVDNDKRIITACHDGRYRVWDLESGNVVYLSQPQDFPVRGVDISPDGRFVATAGWDSVLRFWERPTGNMAQSILRHSGRVNAVRFGASGHKVATACTDGTLRIWNLAGQQAPKRFGEGWSAHHNGFAVRIDQGNVDLRKFGERIEMPEIGIETDQESKVFLTERGDFLVVKESHVGSEYVISLVDLDQEGFATRQTEINFEDDLNFADVSRERMSLIVGGQHTVQVYDIASGQSDWPPIKKKHEIKRMFLSHSGEQLVVQSSREVSVMDIDGLGMIQGPIRTGNELEFSVVSADDSILAVCESDSGLDKRSAFLYRFGESNEPVAELKHGDGVQKVAFHPNSHELVTASEDGSAVIWNVKSGEPLYRVLRHKGPVQDVVYTKDGRFILTSSSDRTVRLWDASSGFPVTPPFLNPWSIGFGTVDPSAKEILCMTSGGEFAWIWRIEGCDYDSDLIVEYGRLLSGNQLSAETSTPDIYEWWRSGRSGSSEDFSVSQSDVVAWHRGQAFDVLMSILRFRGQFNWEDFDRLVRAEAFHIARLDALNMPRNLADSEFSRRIRNQVRKKREALDAK